MIKTEEIQTTTQVVVDILCNKCGESCATSTSDHGWQRSFDGLLEVEVHAGYWSKVLGDGFRTKFSLCEMCVSELFKTFKLPVVDFNADVVVEDTD